MLGRRAALLLFTGLLFVPIAQAEVLSEPSMTEGYSVTDFSRLLKLKTNVELLQHAHKSRVAEGRELINTPLGDVAMRWPRSGVNTSSVRAADSVKAAWGAVAAALEQLGFPERLRSANYDWNLVLQNGVPTGGKGRLLSSAHCHTAWMGPPADIVVNYDRLLNPCGAAGGERAPAQILTGALIHEIAHAVEFQLLDKGFSRRQRWHSEWFASWFESVIVDGMSGASGHRSLNAELKERAKRMFKDSWSPYTFDGSPADYARSFTLISAIVELRGVQGLVAIYDRMARDNCVFADAVQAEFGWDQRTWWQEARQALDRSS